MRFPTLRNWFERHFTIKFPQNFKSAGNLEKNPASIMIFILLAKRNVSPNKPCTSTNRKYLMEIQVCALMPESHDFWTKIWLSRSLACQTADIEPKRIWGRDWQECRISRLWRLAMLRILKLFSDTKSMGDVSILGKASPAFLVFKLTLMESKIENFPPRLRGRKAFSQVSFRVLFELVTGEAWQHLETGDKWKNLLDDSMIYREYLLVGQSSFHAYYIVL